VATGVGLLVGIEHVSEEGVASAVQERSGEIQKGEVCFCGRRVGEGAVVGVTDIYHLKKICIQEQEARVRVVYWKVGAILDLHKSWFVLRFVCSW